jgi:hypothetical protein
MRRIEDRVGKPTFALARNRHFGHWLERINATSRAGPKKKPPEMISDGLFLSA